MRANRTTPRTAVRLAVAASTFALLWGDGGLSHAQTQFQQPRPPEAFIPAQPVPERAPIAQPAANPLPPGAGQPNAATAANAATNVASNPNLEEVLSAALKAAGMVNSPTAPVQTESLPNPVAGPAPPQPPQPADQSLLIPLLGAADPAKALVHDDSNGLVSLMIRQGSLRQVVSMIAETQKLNIVFAGPDDVLVTASFDRQPWQTVLDSLLSASGHAWTTRGNVIFVSRVDAAGFIPPGAEGRQVEVFELDFASAVDVDQTIKGLLSPAGKSWLMETSSTDNRRTKESVAVIDYPSYLGRISDYVCQADQPPRQVLIEAHILQVELTEDCRNGVNFNNMVRLSSSNVALKSVGFANPAAGSGFLVDANGVGLDGLVELLLNTTDSKVLASPRILVVSGQESRIQIGEQLGFRVTTTTQTSTLESVQFLDVGVVLKVIPRVTRDGRVLMRVKPEVSTGQVSPDTGLPSEETAEVETDVLLNSGQGMVIGGLIQEKDTNVQSKVPLLGDIPYAGLLFQKRQVIKSRSEIIVTLLPHVTPYCPIDQARNDAEFIRSAEPLTHRAIARYPRPYEPRLPDALFNHRFKHRYDDFWADDDIVKNFGASALCEYPTLQGDLEELPPVPPPDDAAQEEVDTPLP